MRIFFTITGTKFRYGTGFMEKGMSVFLEKDPGNEHDKEAIRVKMEGLDIVGYVANSPHTVIGDSWSAGRLYDRIGDSAEGSVLYVMNSGVVCTLDVE